MLNEAVVMCLQTYVNEERISEGEEVALTPLTDMLRLGCDILVYTVYCHLSAHCTL